MLEYKSYYKQKINRSMRGSRKKMINVTCSEGLRKRVDQFLTSEYKSWRQSNQPKRDNQGIFTCGSKSSNALIMDYIRFVYSQYNIRDPLDGTSFIITQQQTLKKSPQFSNASRDSQTERRKQIKIEDDVNPRSSNVQQYQVIQPKQLFFNNNQQVNVTPVRKSSRQASETLQKQKLYESRETQQNTTLYHNVDNSYIQQDRGLFASAQKSHQSTKFNGREGSKDQSFFKQIQSLSLAQNEQNSKFSNGLFTPKPSKSSQDKKYFPFSNSVHSQNSKKQSVIPQIYRYCIACQQAVLDANVQRHEMSCEQFGKIYQLDLQGILKHLNIKINNLKQKVKDKSSNLKEQDPTNMKKYCDTMNQQCEDIVKSGQLSSRFINNYDQAIKLSRRWCETSQHINKLRWFAKMREHIKQHFNV